MFFIDQNYYTVSEVALLLKIKKSYVYDLIAQNRLKAIRFSERRIRIPESALVEFINSKGFENNSKVVPTPVRWGRKLKNGTN